MVNLLSFLLKIQYFFHIDLEFCIVQLSVWYGFDNYASDYLALHLKNVLYLCQKY